MMDKVTTAQASQIILQSSYFPLNPDNLPSRPHLMNRRIYPALKILSEKYPTQFCEAFQRMNFER